MALTQRQFNEIETQGRMTIVLAAAQLYVAGINTNAAVDIAFQIFDRVCEVEKIRENA